MKPYYQRCRHYNKVRKVQRKLRIERINTTYGMINCACALLNWFLLGTGRMPHPVGGAMGVTLLTAVKRDTPALISSH